MTNGPTLAQALAAFERADADYAREIAAADLQVRKAKAHAAALRRQRAGWRKQQSADIRKASARVYARDYARLKGDPRPKGSRNDYFRERNRRNAEKAS